MSEHMNDLVVTSRPGKTTRAAIIAAAVVFVVFLIVAIVMPHANAGAHFSWKDQVSTGVLGVILAGFILVLTRPRLRADASGVHIRNHWGPYKTIPWDVIVGVEFPKGRRFARLVLPADETIALLAVQRADREHAVAVMRDLRELLAQSR